MGINNILTYPFFKNISKKIVLCVTFFFQLKNHKTVLLNMK